MTYQVGDRIKYGRVYGTIKLITENVCWFHQDETGAYRFAPKDGITWCNGQKVTDEKQGGKNVNG